MTYVTSDIHGCYKEFLRMLEKIAFTDGDTLFIIGDVVDRGKDGIKLLQDLMLRPNIYLLMGNHEYRMTALLRSLPPHASIDTFMAFLDGKQLQDFALWMSNGGRPTFEAYMALNEDAKSDILDFLEELPLYDELLANGKEYILVHSGLANFHKDKPLSEYRPDELLFERMPPDTQYYDDKTVLAGHTPTFSINKTRAGKIHHAANFINIDCGCFAREDGGRLGCIRLEDMAEFYI